jgi:hypothetical protein
VTATALRRAAVLLTAVAAVVIGPANASGAFGQSPAQFAADSDANLRVAGWAFSIWGPLYAGLLAFAGWQLLRRSDGRLTQLLGWPAAGAFAGLFAWIIAAGADAEAATAVIIISTLLTLAAPLWAGAAEVRAASGAQRRLVVWPLGALAGWLSVASPVNVVTVLTGNGDLPGPALAWSLMAVVGVALAALAMSRRLGTLAYALPVGWGLAGVAAAEWSRNPLLAWTALACGFAAVAGGWALAGRYRRSP